MNGRRTLIVFARLPVMGTVKRRLARDIGTVAATAFYRQCLATTLRRLAADRRWETWLAVTPDRAADSPALPPGTRRLAQGAGDLGARMARALAGAPPGPAVLVGTDIPDMGPAHIASAFRLLGRHDAVFGPAHDGGYWLVGLRRTPRFLDPFATVRWSGPDALADTLANLRHRRVALLDPLEDVDDGASHARWQRRQRPEREQPVSG